MMPEVLLPGSTASSDSIAGASILIWTRSRKATQETPANELSAGSAISG
jgi:hypothetical protein